MLFRSQGEELEPARKKAQMLGVKEIFMDDLREEFVRDFVMPMFRANALYEGQYLLGTSIARPLIAKRQIEIARQVGADAVSHGATGKGNDQVRFELSYYALQPDIRVIAPWREWDLDSRTALIEFAEKNQIPIAKDKRGEAPFSVDSNLLHISAEGKALEDPWQEPGEYVYSRSVAPEQAPDQPEYVEIEFLKGDPVAVNGKAMSPAEMLTELNALGGKHGIGRLDKVENRYVGMKSRGCYETPGGTILLTGHRRTEANGAGPQIGISALVGVSAQDLVSRLLGKDVLDVNTEYDPTSNAVAAEVSKKLGKQITLAVKALSGREQQRYSAQFQFAVEYENVVPLSGEQDGVNLYDVTARLVYDSTWGNSVQSVIVCSLASL